MTNVLNKGVNHRIINVTPCISDFKNDPEPDAKQNSNSNENKPLKNDHNTLTVNRASSFVNSFDSLSDNIRPLTARSLPIPGQSVNSNPPKIKLINVHSKDSQDKVDQDSNGIKYSVSTPALNKIRNDSLKNSKLNLKTNLDNYLDYSVSPFTTKYEIIGKTKKIDSEPIRRIRSSNNFNHDIILPNQIHPYTIQNADESSKSNYFRITNNLFCGNINSIKNERKLCTLNIDYLIDMTNMRPDELNRQTLGKIPCNCQKQHSRLFISIEINQTDFKSLFNAFGEVNQFIQKARKSSNDKRVLIFGKETCSPQVICAAAQYLMVEYEMSLETALQSVLQKNYSIICSKLDECYLNFLSEFEKYLKHVSEKIFGRLSYNDSFDSEESGVFKTKDVNLKAKRDMFEENFEFFNDDNYDEDEDDDDEDVFENNQSSLTNLKESDEIRKNKNVFKLNLAPKKFNNFMQTNENGKKSVNIPHFKMDSM